MSCNSNRFSCSSSIFWSSEGVSASLWVKRRSSDCRKCCLRLFIFSIQPEALTQINFPDFLVTGQFARGTPAQDLTFTYYIGPVGYIQSLPNIMIGNQD